MSRVAGINPTGANKATDMYLKVRYIQELTPGKNVVLQLVHQSAILCVNCIQCKSICSLIDLKN